MNSKLEFSVGLFIILGLLAIAVLAFQVAGIGLEPLNNSYRIKAQFSNIGTLKPRAPVKIGGVIIGRVGEITLSRQDFIPTVTLNIQGNYDQLPETSSASILTSGLLGEQYISIVPGFIDEEMGIGYLKEGSLIQDTRSALVLEELIGKFLFNRDS